MRLRLRKLLVRPCWVLPICVIFTAFAVTGCGNDIVEPKAQANSKSNQLAKSIYSGEDLYRGIFFAYGEVAGMIPEIRDHLMAPNGVFNSQQKRTIENFQNRVIQSINTVDGGFLSSFGAAMQSGNHIIIDKKLNEAARITVKALSQIPEIQTLREKIKKNPDMLHDVVRELKQHQKLERLDDDMIEKAINVFVANSLNGGDIPEEPAASVFVFIIAVGAIFLAVTVLVAQSYAGVLNIAGAINVVGAVVAWVEIVEPAGADGSPSLMREQIINSVALIFSN